MNEPTISQATKIAHYFCLTIVKFVAYGLKGTIVHEDIIDCFEQSVAAMGKSILPIIQDRFPKLDISTIFKD